MKKIFAALLAMATAAVLYALYKSNVWSGFLSHLTEMQYSLRSTITGKAAEYRATGSSKGVFLIVLFSFVYGLVHAAGPGHNKAAVSAYTVSRGISGVKAAFVGALSGMFHGLMSMCLVFGVYYLTDMHLSGAIDSYGNVFASVSSVSLILFGLYLFAASFRKQEPRKEGNLIFTFISGMIPCPATFTVGTFFLAVRMPVMAFAGTLALTLGMMVTTSLASVTAGYAGKGLFSSFEDKYQLITRFSALCLSFFGVLLYLMH